ncbi:MAG: magnesium-translocating P-type ATPase [Christensenellales bacterium]
MKKVVKRNHNSSAIQDRLITAANSSTDELLSEYETSRSGLSFEQVGERLDYYGDNTISYEKQDAWYTQLFKAFVNPFSLILIAIVAVSFFIDVILAAPNERSYTTVAVIAVLVTLSGLMRFFQELRSNKQVNELKHMVHTTVTVERQETGKTEIPLSEAVPGDIIYLSAGDMVPADVRLLASRDLFVSQSSLTGESEPIEKLSNLSEKHRDKKNSSPLSLENLCFMGTNVVSGAAVAVVLSTGDHTYFGSMAKTLTGRRAITSFDKGVNSVSWLLIRFMLIMVPVVFFVNGLTKGDWLQALLFALSIAIGLTPEMLPMIVTTNLAKGAVNMAKRKTVVKRLNSIQNFGAMDVLCTDKTGTLTRDKIVLERYLDIHGNEDDRVLRHAYVNSYYQTGLKNLMDIAILDHADERGFMELRSRYTKVDEIPFDFNRRRMSVVVKDRDGKTQMVTKGAVEEMLSICSHAEYHGNIVVLDQEIRSEIMEMVTELSDQGMRVVAVAQKNNPSMEGILSVKDESDMVLMGYIGFLDPPKKTVTAALRALHGYGVAVKVLTGDNELVTRRICSMVELPVKGILVGGQIEQMNEGELSRAVEEATIFAKLSPLQKVRIVKSLQANGHTVGFLGDGINDAAALKESDVGISVDTAVDIAKESADIVLMEKDLMVLEKCIIEGRRTFGNIIKYIKMTASSNFGNMLSVLVASVFLPFLPMLPVQILALSLLYNISQISIPWDTMDPAYLLKPKKWDAKGIGRFMGIIGPCSSLFDIATFLLMWYIFGCNTASDPMLVALFHSAWFVESLMTQTMVVHMIRTEKIPFIQSRAAKPVLLLTFAVIVIGVILPFTAAGAFFKMTPLPLGFFPFLALILACYITLTQFVKMLYIRRFKTFL